MRSALQDIRYGFRSLLKNPGFTLVAVLTLALGIGANTAIFSVVENVLLQPLPYPHPEQLVEVFNTYFPQVPRGGLSPGDYADWCIQNKSFAAMGGYAEISTGLNLTGDGEPQRVQAGFASASLFPMLGVRAAVGRTFVTEEDRAGNAPVVILSHRLWQNRFGSDPAVIGRTVALDNKRYTVIGVLPAGFQLLRWADLWMPFGQYDDDLTEHIHHAFTVIARLRPGVSVAQAQEEMNALNRMEAIAYPDAHKNFGVEVQPLQDPSAAKLRTTLLMLFGAVGLILLIACANLVNLLLVRNAAREREISLRTALGAGPWRLVRQLLTETLLLALIGCACGVLLALGGLKLLAALVPGDLAILREVALNRFVLAFSLGVALLAGFACGVLPALRTLKLDLAGVLKQGTKGSSAPGHHRTHNLLVISEIAMAIVPLIGAGLLLRSFQHLLAVDPGFRSDHLLTLEIQQPVLSFAEYSKLSLEEKIKLSEKQSLQFDQIVQQVRAIPGVRDAGGIDDLPLGTELRQATRFVIEGQPAIAAGARPIAQNRNVSLSYFETAGIPLLAGRSFTEDDWKQFGTAVINQTMAKRFWPNGDALGKRINLCSLDSKACWFTIAGIVGDVHQFGLDAGATYDVYLSGGWTPYLLVRSTLDAAALTPSVTEIVHKVDPTLPISSIMTMDSLLADSVAPRRFSAVLTGIFAALALLLAAVGVYGVMSYTVSGRTQEIGIRMALGAAPGAVQAMILRESAVLMSIGAGAGLLTAFVVARFLESLLFGVSSHDAPTFGAVTVLLMSVALLAAYIPARRAVRVNPLIALRQQ